MIQKIEKKFKKELEQLPEWSYLRNYYREAQTYTIDGRNNISKKEIIKQAFYGFKNWFRGYDYIIFSDTSERKFIDETWFDIKSDYIAKLLGKTDTLIIESPFPNHKTINSVFSKKIVSRRLLDIFSLLLEKMNRKIYTNKVLDKINDFIEIDFNYSAVIDRFDARYKVYKFWFEIVKPKMIFLNCYYDKQYIVKVAKELNIQVVDIQHGLIGESHSAYYSDIKLNNDYLPNSLFVFGKQDKKNISQGGIFDRNDICEVGNFYLEYLRNNFTQDEKLSQIIQKYKLSIGVSLQWTVEDKMINFINSVAKKQKDTLFIFIPREYKDDYKKLDLENNVMFYPKLDCYQIIMHCHYHCTVYSTCAIEAPSLGIPNILVNLDCLTSKYMNNMFNNNTACIVNTEDEFMDFIKKDYQLDKIKIIKLNESFFVSNYEENIAKALNLILKGKK